MSSNIQGHSGLTAAFTSGAFADAASNINITNAATITYSINGVFASRTTVASQAVTIEPNTGIDPRNPNSFQILPAGKSCAYAIILDGSGNFTVAQGPIVDQGSACPLPGTPVNKLIVGAFKVVNASYVTNGGYRAGTDAKNSAGLTTTYFNLTGHPGYAL